MVTGLDALTYLANLASLEFHVPQWQIGADGLPAFPCLLYTSSCV